MQLTTMVKQLTRNDSRLVRRDQFLVTMLSYPIILALVERFGVPPLQSWLLESYNFDLTPYYPLIVSFVSVLATPLLLGLVLGFLLLDERDDNTLTAMLVTPVSLNSFVFYRVGLAALVSFVVILLTVPLAGLVTLPVLDLLLISATAALFAPIVALLLFSFAENKVQGFALLKGISSLNVMPLLAAFVAEPWQYLFGLYPAYWPVRAFWDAAAGDSYALFLFIGLAYYVVVLAVAVRRFHRHAYA